MWCGQSVRSTGTVKMVPVAEEAVLAVWKRNTAGNKIQGAGAFCVSALSLCVCTIKKVII